MVLNGKAFQWADAAAGVPQGSIFGSLSILVYMNDLSEDSSSNVKLFADDTSLLPKYICQQIKNRPRKDKQLALSREDEF